MDGSVIVLAALLRLIRRRPRRTACAPLRATRPQLWTAVDMWVARLRTLTSSAIRSSSFDRDQRQRRQQAYDPSTALSCSWHELLWRGLLWWRTLPGEQRHGAAVKEQLKPAGVTVQGPASDCTGSDSGQLAGKSESTWVE
jgi:hypothetical protein